MSKVQTVRELVNQRLTAAVEEIFGLFERTIAEYEEELCRSKEKNERQQKLLDAVLKPEVRLHRAGIQQLVVVKEEVPPEQQEWSPSLDQEDPPEPPHIKEEQEELWTSQEGEQLQGLEEADITKFLFTPVPVKSEDDEEKPQSSQLHQRQTEQMETGADGEDCGGPEPARNSHPDPELRPETEDSEDWNYSTEHDQNHKCVSPQSSQLHQQDKTEDSSDTEHSNDWSKEIREPPSGSKSLKNNEVSKSGVRCNTEENPLSFSLCGKAFRGKKTLKRHVAVHTGEKRFSCSVCEKGFKRKQTLTLHMAIHTGQKPFKCSVCEKAFTRKGSLTLHMAIHRGEKRFCCSVCDQRFTWRYQLAKHKCVSPQSSQLHQQDKTEDSSDTEHSDDWSKDIREPPSGSKSLNNNEVSKNGVRCNTKENPFSCSLCGKAFRQKKTLKRHMVVHTVEKRFRCSVCERSFKWNDNLTRHMAVHSDTRDKPFKCSVCEKSFALKGGLMQHMTVHKAEKLFSCSVCEKSFKRKQDMNGHMVIHSGEKRFSCSVCKRRFKHNEHVTRHMVVHTKEKPFKCSVCEKAFTQKGTLTHHMAVHTGEKIFCCSVCDQRFARRYQLIKHKSVCPQSSQLHQTEQNREAEPGARLILKRHMRTHTGEKLRSCSVRGKSSTQTESLTKHSSVNTGDRLFNCSVCNKRFTRFTDVKNHKCVGPQSSQLQQQDKTEDSSDTEHSDDWSKDVREPPSDSKSLNKNEVSKSGVRCNSKENPLSCSLCGKAFSQKTNLRRHMAVHTGEKMFSCSVCEGSFKRKDNLTRHMAIHTGDKPFKCSVCEKAFTQKDNLRQHMGIHSNGKIFCCSFCDKSFAWAIQLRRHKRVCPQSSQLHPTEQNREAEPGASSSRL